MSLDFETIINNALPSLKAHVMPTETDQDRIAKALSIAICGLMTDGAHHKQWSLDQIVRALTGCPIETATTTDYQNCLYSYQAQGMSPEYIALTRQTCYRPDGTRWNWSLGQPA